MTDLAHYKTVVENCFGLGSATFNPANVPSNNLLRAFGSTTFADFTNNFSARLHRLNARYPSTHAARPYVLHLVNEIAERNWDGAYSELVAYDFLNDESDWLRTPIALSKTVPALESLANRLGKPCVNFDGYFDDFDVFFDVKMLTDKSRSILDGVIADAKKATAVTDIIVVPQYDSDDDFEQYSTHRRELVAELATAITLCRRTATVTSRSLPHLKFNLLRGAGAVTGSSVYDPYLHATNHHTLLLNHIKNFSTTRPSLIVFVLSPWFSEPVANLDDSNTIFYRALCRRFFCQYRHDPGLASQQIKHFIGPESLYEVTRKLSGVLFLQDDSINATSPTSQNIAAHIYLNPNAEFPIGAHFRDYLSSLASAISASTIDDFHHDNY